MSDKSVWHQLLESRISHRNALKGSLLAAASALPISLQAAAITPKNASGSSPRISGQAAASIHDAQDSCVYKIVSASTYDPKNREANLRLLETGKLYAADY